VTIEHQFGETTIEEEPQRVVSLGLQEHDTIFALGVEPVAVRYWYGPEDDVIHLWAEEAAGDADPETLDHDLLVWDQLAYTPGGRATIEGDRLVQRPSRRRDGPP
jgi:iron complex transport system substrate-binding protein